MQLQDHLLQRAMYIADKQKRYVRYENGSCCVKKLIEGPVKACSFHLLNGKFHLKGGEEWLEAAQELQSGLNAKG